ncbi:MAG: tRNA (guanosine(46)-N7)-methyltransferase TrmB [Bacteroidales bacterium]|nr:tRNA (guanosine(46)-N7)-methyltransferase TrmB [Bacteroidales bacterium]
METFRNVIQPGNIEDFGVSHPLKGNWNKEVFCNSNPLVLELACGRGEYTTGLASRFPLNNYVGIDIKGARMWRGAKTAIENKLGNVAFLRIRIEFISSFFAEDEVDEIWIIFPDPQPGKKNSNKRLTSPWFLNNYRNFLKNNGIIHLKTDNIELFDYTAALVAGNDLEIIRRTSDLYSDNPENEILSIRTHYEKSFLSKGLKINYISFRLNKEKVITDGTTEKQPQ